MGAPEIRILRFLPGIRGRSCRPKELSDEELEAFTLVDFGAPEWDIFDSAGRFLGVVMMPARFAPAVFRADKIYGAWHDEHDLPYVVRLRIVGDLAVGAG